MGATVVLARLAVLGALALTVEGFNIMSGGELYLNSVSHLAQVAPEGGTTAPPPPPPPPPETAPTTQQPSVQQYPVPAPGGTTGQFPQQPGQQFNPPPQGGAGEAFRTPFPQPPGGQFQPGMPGQPGQPGQQFQNGFQQPRQGQKPSRIQPRQPLQQNGVGPDGFPGQGSKESFPGQGTKDNFPGMGPNGEEQFPLEQQFDFGEEEDFEEPPINPRELRDVREQAKNLQREITSILKRIAKLPGAAAYQTQLNDLLNQAKDFAVRFSSQNVTRADLQDFWDARLWDEFNPIRIVAQFATEEKQLNLTIARLGKRTKVKAFTTMAGALGLNTESIRGKIAEWQNALQQARQAVASGDPETIQEILEEAFYREGQHPGNAEGYLNQLQNIYKSVKAIRDQSTRTQILGMLAESIAAANDGDFQEASESLRDQERDIFEIINSASRSRVKR